MIYSYERRIAMSHVDENWKLNPAAPWICSKNCAMFHTVERGAVLDALKEENLAWVINSWNVYFDRPVIFWIPSGSPLGPTALTGFLPTEIFSLRTAVGRPGVRRTPCGFSCRWTSSSPFG